jgi:hypothetical protein
MAVPMAELKCNHASSHHRKEILQAILTDQTSMTGSIVLPTLLLTVDRESLMRFSSPFKV